MEDRKRVTHSKTTVAHTWGFVELIARPPTVPLIVRAAHAAAAVYQRGSRAVATNQRLRQENRLLRGEIRHCLDVIDSMGRDMEMDEDRHAQRAEWTYLPGVAAATVTSHTEHQRAITEAREDALLQGFETGYKAGLADRRRSRPPRAQRRRLTGDS
ncbi:hypothetical protein [Salinispora arenicola]|uniref:hypothetical protein n=1 Tax=Salinispora arenicola TaxID=168697 RepID=UPI0027DB3D15|nr:hypothetical protein [Salinispora arenicola]